MTRAPTVSIAVPLYNKRAFIAEAVASALVQSFADLEIVVVDDGSTDGGANELRNLDDPRLVVIKQDNAGAGAARTRALREGRGMFVAFLDADDVWLPDHLYHLMELVHRFPQCAMFGNGFAETAPAEPLPAVEYRILDDYFSDCADGHPPFYTSSCMVRRQNALDVGAFAAGKVCGEDLALWMRLAAQAPVAISSYIGCHYRRGGDSLSRQSSYRNAPDVSMATLKELLQHHRGWSTDRRRSVNEYFYRLALAHCLDCLRAGEVREARSFLRLSAETSLQRNRLWIGRALALAPSPIRAALFRLSDLAKR